jgi:hypothetical protein
MHDADDALLTTSSLFKLMMQMSMQGRNSPKKLIPAVAWTKRMFVRDPIDLIVRLHIGQDYRSGAKSQIPKNRPSNPF